MTFMGALRRSHIGLNHGPWRESSRPAVAAKQFFDRERRLCYGWWLGPTLEAHATKNRYRRFFFCICRRRHHFALRLLDPASGGFPDGIIQKPGSDVQSDL